MVNGLCENAFAMLYNVMIMLWKRMEGRRMTRMKKGKNDEWKNENECMNVLRYLTAYVWMNDGTKLRVRIVAILYGLPGMAYLSAP